MQTIEYWALAALAVSLLALGLLYVALDVWLRRERLRAERGERMIARIVYHYAPGFGAREERQS